MLRADHHPADMKADYTFEHRWESYTAADHQVWRQLFNRQAKILVNRACDEYLESLPRLGVTAEGIPDFRRMSDILEKTTGWTIVTVPGLIPGEVFHKHLSERRFPVTYWIRTPEQIDYLAEPDVFHDLYGHVPMLMNPIFADYIQEFGKGGVKADNLQALHLLGRLYWYTVEFGLINTKKGLRIYGAGIVSSKTESVYCLEDPRPHRIAFELERCMRTEYRYDKLQETYFVLDGFEQLFEATRPDFAPIYEKLKPHPEIQPYLLQPGDKVLHAGTIQHEQRAG